MVMMVVTVAISVDSLADEGVGIGEDCVLFFLGSDCLEDGLAGDDFHQPVGLVLVEAAAACNGARRAARRW